LAWVVADYTQKWSNTASNVYCHTRSVFSQLVLCTLNVKMLIKYYNF